MRKLLFLLFFCSLVTGASAQQQKEVFQIHLQQCASDTWGDLRHSGHRTPPVAPEVYLDNEHFILLFGMPCFESTIQLIIPGTDTSVYTYVIPDGDTEVQFPTSLSGEYELHIHRGNYCFCGVIELL